MTGSRWLVSQSTTDTSFSDLSAPSAVSELEGSSGDLGIMSKDSIFPKTVYAENLHDSSQKIATPALGFAIKTRPILAVSTTLLAIPEAENGGSSASSRITDGDFCDSPVQEDIIFEEVATEEILVAGNKSFSKDLSTPRKETNLFSDKQVLDCLKSLSQLHKLQE